jgi:hypothetical protein
MADAEDKPKASGISGGDRTPSDPLGTSPVVTPQSKIAEALSKIPDVDAKAMLSIALSKTTLGFGPDPETARIIAESEMHEEDCRLKGYTAQLQNKDLQSSRDHEFRCKRLNREFAMTISVLAASIAGAATGLYLLMKDTLRSAVSS